MTTISKTQQANCILTLSLVSKLYPGILITCSMEKRWPRNEASWHCTSGYHRGAWYLGLGRQGAGLKSHWWTQRCWCTRDSSAGIEELVWRTEISFHPTSNEQGSRTSQPNLQDLTPRGAVSTVILLMDIFLLNRSTLSQRMSLSSLVPGLHDQPGNEASPSLRVRKAV